MKELIEELRQALLDKELSPERAASGYLIGCSGQSIRRWLKGTKPNPIFRKAIEEGINKIQRDAP
jgi:hypothetical protein